MMELYIESFILLWASSTWQIIVASAPFLLIGFLIAGIIYNLFPQHLIEKYLKIPGYRSVLYSSAFGIPLPLCSCSVIPVAVALRKKGSSKGAMASFLVSTPEIGIDSFLLSFALMGPMFAISRVIASFISAFLVGISIENLVDKAESVGVASIETKSCCSEPITSAQKTSLGKTIKDTLRYGFVDIAGDITRLLVIGYVFSGLIAAVIPPNYFNTLTIPFWAILSLMLFASLPVYVCATASTPLAATLVAKGLDPGAAMVFLLAGPATNITTMLVVKRELGSRALALYLSGITIVAISAGVIFHGLSDALQISDLALQIFDEHAHISGLQTALAFMLCALLLFHLIGRQLKQKQL